MPAEAHQTAKSNGRGPPCLSARIGQPSPQLVGRAKNSFARFQRWIDLIGWVSGWLAILSTQAQGFRGIFSPPIAGPPRHQRARRRIDHSGDRPISRTLVKSLEHVEHRLESMFRCSDSCAHLLTLGKLMEGCIPVQTLALYVVSELFKTNTNEINWAVSNSPIF